MNDNEKLTGAMKKAMTPDDEKVSMVINGEKLDGIDPKGQDIPELRKNKIDYSRFKDLTDFFTHGLLQFSKFISLNIPDEFKKSNPDEQELHSSRNGITAYNKCIKLLQKELRTGKTGYKQPHDYKKLSDWYVNGMIDFMGITMVDVPDELDDLDDPDYIVKCAIQAFKNVKNMLLNNIQEMTSDKE